MGAAMAVVMLTFMLGMHKNKNKNKKVNTAIYQDVQVRGTPGSPCSKHECAGSGTAVGSAPPWEPWIGA
ncbi:MAG: hypothetical protein JJE52_05085 [Acidimicrobiia bacterium]|nr:hypothetical protein [Acidimicrobiia bacterium]